MPMTRFKFAAWHDGRQDHWRHLRGHGGDGLLRGNVARIPYGALPMGFIQINRQTIPLRPLQQDAFDRTREVVHRYFDRAEQLCRRVCVDKGIPDVCC